MLDRAKSSYPSIAIPFFYAKVPQNTTGTMNAAATNATAGTLNSKAWVAPANGHIYGLSFSQSELPTAGTLVLTPIINGVLATNLAVDTTMNDARVQHPYEIVEANKSDLAFSAGQTIHLRFLTDAAYAPNNNVDVNALLLVVLDNIDY